MFDHNIVHIWCVYCYNENKTTSKMSCPYSPRLLQAATGSREEFRAYRVAHKYYQSVRRIYVCTQPEHEDIFTLFDDVTRSFLFYLFYAPATTDTMNERIIRWTSPRERVRSIFVSLELGQHLVCTNIRRNSRTSLYFLKKINK